MANGIVPIWPATGPSEPAKVSSRLGNPRGRGAPIARPDASLATCHRATAPAERWITLKHLIPTLKHLIQGARESVDAGLLVTFRCRESLQLYAGGLRTTIGRRSSVGDGDIAARWPRRTLFVTNFFRKTLQL